MSEQLKKRILCVDDDVDTVELFKLCLSDYQVFSAHTVAEGVSLARLRHFDLYLLDNWLADWSGIEMCRQIRRFDPNTPIIFVSAVTMNEARQEAMSVGAQAYFVKPVDFDEVARTVAQFDRDAHLKSIEARVEEIAVMREEMSLQRQQISARRAEIAKKKDEAVERLLKMKARMAFFSAGGTRADFERMWPELSLDESAFSAPPLNSSITI